MLKGFIHFFKEITTKYSPHGCIKFTVKWKNTKVMKPELLVQVFNRLRLFMPSIVIAVNVVIVKTENKRITEIMFFCSSVCFALSNATRTKQFHHRAEAYEYAFNIMIMIIKHHSLYLTRRSEAQCNKRWMTRFFSCWDEWKGNFFLSALMNALILFSDSFPFQTLSFLSSSGSGVWNIFQMATNTHSLQWNDTENWFKCVFSSFEKKIKEISIE